jgi:NCAIR mutase (PurE)-related protein
MNDLATILERYRTGEMDLDTTLAAVRGTFFEDLGHSTLDVDRARRTGAAEVIYGAAKTPDQIVAIATAMLARGQNVLVTRASVEAFEHLRERAPDARRFDASGAVTIVREPPAPAATTIAIVSAGTSDLPVAEEAAVTAGFYGSPVAVIQDVGVAGIHRLFARLDEIRTARVVVVVAGMEGALPSVVGGLVERPVIAVPTSVGYGASFGGLSALLGMLNSCASGLSVVNIDNGFGAGYLANMINRL